MGLGSRFVNMSPRPADCLTEQGPFRELETARQMTEAERQNGRHCGRKRVGGLFPPIAVATSVGILAKRPIMDILTVGD
jgi:hypothetical protein